MEFVSNGGALETFLRREYKTPPAVPEKNSSQPAESEYEAFSYGRVGIRPQLMLSFRKANGLVKVRPYALLQGLDSDDENSAFALSFPGLVVTVQGRNLSRLFVFICLHRVAEINEADTAMQFTESESNCVVASLGFTEQYS